MIMNIQQNAGPPAYAQPPQAYAPPPPPPQQAAPAPVFIQQERKSNTCCIVVTTVCCVVCIIPVIIYAVFVLMFLNAASNVASQFPDSSFNYSTSTYPTSTSTYIQTSTFAPNTFTNAGLLSYSANICNGYFKYTATASGSLKSPNYPSYYPNNSNCINRIETASNGVTFQINGFYTEDFFDTVVFNGAYKFDGDYSIGGPQVGDRFSFSYSQVDVHFSSDYVGQHPGFNFSVIDGYEPHNDISFLGYASRIINKEDIPIKTV